MDCDGCALVVFIHRRSFGNINEAKQISLEDALSSKEIHAAFISTENRSHEETIRYFQMVFFPLFPTFPLQFRSIEELCKPVAGDDGGTGGETVMLEA